ncbi:DNA (cytosine-5-)-methyltransferase [Canibacter sp. lx-45]|nr:DNA (cytosine-5-)-methyltransferase [Canibacter zhuwentaonis]
MHGGPREGAGRRAVIQKRKAYTVYLSEEDYKKIDSLPLPSSSSFSQKCRELIGAGIDKIENELSSKSGEVAFIDLFSGLGGIRIGFEQALHENGLVGKCVFSSDVKAAAIKAYEKNFGHNAECDITRVNPSNLPNFDFLLAGFPCQAFSQVGLGLGFQDTRGTLFFDIAKILLEKKPLGFVLENVEGLVTHDKGNTFKVITQTLLDLGYSISHSILDGKDFGLAQSRKRIYIIGFRSKNIEQLENFEFTHSVLEDVIDSNTPPVESEFSKKITFKV